VCNFCGVYFLFNSYYLYVDRLYLDFDSVTVMELESDPFQSLTFRLAIHWKSNSDASTINIFHVAGYKNLGKTDKKMYM
jgi:hypothetical protein